MTQKLEATETRFWTKEEQILWTNRKSKDKVLEEVSEQRKLVTVKRNKMVKIYWTYREKTGEREFGHVRR